MDLCTGSRNVLRTSILVLASLAISGLAWGQHGQESRGQGEHEGNAGRSGGQGHEGGPSHASGPSRENSHVQRAPAGARDGGARAGKHLRTPAIGLGTRVTTAAGTRPATTETIPATAAETLANQGRTPSGNRGGYTANNRGGVNSHRAPGRTVSLRGGGSASFRPNGQIRTINRNGMRIQHNLRGGRTIVTERAGVRIVARGGGRGYVQRAYITRGGRSFYSRTYYDHGVYRVGIYRGYYYGGRHYYGYYPGYWYHPAFYGWAYRPWGAPVYWGVGIGGWGWGPWYGYYGGYFAPYSVYPSAAFWLTDYLIAANLQAAYDARAEARADAAAQYYQSQPDYGDGGGGQAANSEPVTLTPEVKQAIAEEVKAQLAAEQQQSSGGQADSYDGQARNGQAPQPASSEVPPALDPARRTFIVSSDISVLSNGQECDLTAGDVITRLTDTPDASQKVTASVSASKKGDCGAGQQIAVSVEDLQDMHNHFQEQLDNGMKDLAQKQGTGGLPKAPDTGTTASDVPVPPPDTDAAKDLTEQEAAADQAETQAKQESAAGPGGDQ